MDDRYTRMLFVIDLLCKEKRIRSMAFFFFLMKRIAQIFVRENWNPGLGRGHSCKKMRSPSQEAFKQRVEELLIRVVVEVTSLRLYRADTIHCWAF